MSSTYLTSTVAGVLTLIAMLRLPADWQRGTAAVIAAASRR